MIRYSEQNGLLQLICPSVLAFGLSLGPVSAEWMSAASAEPALLSPAISRIPSTSHAPARARSIESPEAFIDRGAGSSTRTIADGSGVRRGSVSTLSPREVAVPEPTLDRPVASRTTLVVDIDETLCVTDYPSVILGIGRDNSTPLPAAQQALSRLAQDYNIVYLTARPHSCENRTRRWLNSRGFPAGPLITSSVMSDLLGQASFKKGMLARLQRQYGQMLIGIGDKPTDAEAYRHNGMLPVVVNPWRNRRYRESEIIIQDWSGVLAFFENNREVLTDARRLAYGLQRGNLPLQLPG